MIGYSATEVFDDALLRDFRRATTLVARLPETDMKGRLVRCHEVARALRGMLQSPLGTWAVVDGHYGTVEHSWLADRQGNILDLYSVARFPMVQLVAAHLFFHRSLFREGPKRADIRHRVVKQLWKAAMRM